MALFDQINTYLADPLQKDKPLFIWVHYYDPHHPYLEKDHIELNDKIPQRDDDIHIRRYDEEIRYTDEAVQALFGFLEAKGLRKNLLTCITADHGEQFFEHDHAYCHADFYAETTHVPLIFHGYGVPKNKVVSTYVSNMDIAVTLLARLGATFDYPTEGIDLLAEKYRENPLPHRKFLIIGNPVHARSLQMIDPPYSYITNFDYHYQYFWVTGPNDIPDSRFSPLPESAVSRGGNRWVVTMPYKLPRGTHFLMLRGDITQNNEMAIKTRVVPFLPANKIELPKTLKQFNAIYPVSILDRLYFNLLLGQGTHIENLRFTLIPSQNLSPAALSPNASKQAANATFSKRIVNKVYQDLFSSRKFKKDDEFYNLDTDIAMKSNLIHQEALKPLMINLKKQGYNVYEYYYKKHQRLVKGGTNQKDLTKDDVKMLKTLGYLEDAPLPYLKRIPGAHLHAVGSG